MYSAVYMHLQLVQEELEADVITAWANIQYTCIYNLYSGTSKRGLGSHQRTNVHHCPWRRIVININDVDGFQRLPSHEWRFLGTSQAVIDA